jgi:hypothetical protein
MNIKREKKYLFWNKNINVFEKRIDLKNLDTKWKIVAT